MDIFTKQPADILDYDADFTPWLPDGDMVTSAIAVVDVVGDLAIDAVGISVDGMIIKVWVSGGLNNGRYKITVTGTTAHGRTKEVDFIIRVRDY